MAKITDLMINSQAAEKGVWADFGSGIRLLIARRPNPKYNAALSP